MELPKKGDIFITPAAGSFFYDTDDRTPKNERRLGLNPQLNIFLGVATCVRWEGSEDPTEYLVYWDSKQNEIDYVRWGERQSIRYKDQKDKSQLWLQKDKRGRWFLQSRSGRKDCPVLLEWLRQGLETEDQGDETQPGILC